MNNELPTSEHAENQKIEINRLLKSNAYLKKENNKLRSTDKALLLKEMDRVISENAKLKEDFAKCSKLLKEMEEKYFPLEDEYEALEDELEKTKEKLKEMIGQRDNLYAAYNNVSENFQELKAKHQFASESCEHICNDCRKLREENDELKGKLHYILGGGIVSETLEPILSETPSVVINTKTVNIIFDNHTNNFKEDDTND